MDDTDDRAVASPDCGEGNRDDDVIDAEVVVSFVESGDEDTLIIEEEMCVSREDDGEIGVNEDSSSQQSARSDESRRSEEPSLKDACEPADNSCGLDSQQESKLPSHGDEKKEDVSDTANRDERRRNVSSSGNKRKRTAPLYTPGTRVEAQDFQLKWYPAKVVKVDEDGDVLIHFEGWSSRYDEWVPADSPRLRVTSQMRKSLTRPSHKKSAYKKGEEVLARWADGRKYAAKILEVHNDETYNVLFYDGFEKRVKGTNMEKMPPEQRGTVTFPEPPPKEHSASRNQEQQQETKVQKKEQRKSSKDATQSEMKGTQPMETELKRSEPKKARPSQSTAKSRDQKHVSKADGGGKKSERKDGSTSSSSSSQNRKKILLVGGKFMAKRNDTQKLKARRKQQETKKESSKRKRGSSAGDGSRERKRERKSSVINKVAETCSSDLPPVPLPPTPAEPGSDLQDSLSFVAPKEFIIEEDHNHFKCTFEGCNKSFRKEQLLQSHLKHYHGATPSPPSAAAPSKRRSVDLQLGQPTVVLERVVHTKQTIPRSTESLEEECASAGEVAAAVSSSEEEVISSAAAMEPSESIAVDSDGELTAPSASPLTPNATAASSPVATPPVDTALAQTSASIEPTDASMEGSATDTCLGVNSTEESAAGEAHRSEGFGSPTLVPDRMPTESTPIIHKPPRKINFVPHFETLVQGREKRKIAKTRKAMIADMEAATNRRGSQTDKKRKRTSSTRSDKSEEGQTRPTTSKEGRRSKALESCYSPLLTDLTNGETVEMPISHRKSKKRRHPPPSISDSSLSSFSATKDFQLPHDQESARGGGYAAVSSDEIVRCICNCEEESGLMMQCEVCLTWQHGSCFSIEEEKDVPDKYVCYSCLCPRVTKSRRLPKIEDKKKRSSGVRENSRYKHDQDWFIRGEMASFSFLKDKVTQSPRQEPVKATHDLMASMHNVFSVLRGMAHKLNIAGQENHPDLKHFAKPWVEEDPGKADTGEKSSEMTAGEMTDFSRPGRDIMVSPYDHTYFGQPECSNGVQEAPDVVVTSLEEAPEEILVQDVDGLEVGCVEEIAGPKSEDSMELDVIACEEEVVAASEEDAASLGAPSGSSLETFPAIAPAVEVEEKVDPEVCKKNLLNHIFSIQDQLEQKLTSMEEQLHILENETDEGISNPSLSEEEEVLKLRLSLKGLMKDLNAVHRLSMFQ